MKENVLLFVVAFVHLVYCPYTKVEESFNIQAAHDFLFYGFNVSQFDHIEFPGVVPRSFIGAYVVAALVYPLQFFLEFIWVPNFKFLMQYLVRGALGGCVLYSYCMLQTSIKKHFGKDVALWMTLITASQYHFMFYLSRPLPNIMALPLVLLALNSWLQNKDVGFIWFSAAAIIIFRSELAIFLGMILLFEIIFKKKDLFRLFKTSLAAGTSLLLCTVIFDSFLWQRFLWPEGEVFWFNTILNKSSEWGTQPFLWYWYSAVPRALGLTVFLVPVGLFLDSRSKYVLMPAVTFITMMSFLPHKELRFIIYTFPLFNVVAACACHQMWAGRHKSLIRWLAAGAVSLQLLGNIIFSLTLLIVAKKNYPGGEAIHHLNGLEPGNSYVHVHISNLAAQTGVTRFTQVHDNWIYNKTENLDANGEEMLHFSHLIVEAKSKYSNNLKPFSATHDVLEVIYGFSHIAFHYKGLPPLKIKTKPMLYILKLKKKQLEKDKRVFKTVPTAAPQQLTKDRYEENLISLEISDSASAIEEKYETVEENQEKEGETFNELNNSRANAEPAMLEDISENKVVKDDSLIAESDSNSDIRKRPKIHASLHKKKAITNDNKEVNDLDRSSKAALKQTGEQSEGSTIPVYNETASSLQKKEKLRNHSPADHKLKISKEDVRQRNPDIHLGPSFKAVTTNTSPEAVSSKQSPESLKEENLTQEDNNIAISQASQNLHESIRRKDQDFLNSKSSETKTESTNETKETYRSQRRTISINAKSKVAKAKSSNGINSTKQKANNFETS